MMPAARPSRSPSEAAPLGRAPGWGALEWSVLAICAALGLLNLWAPFTWDQAIFAMGAEKILHGGLLYHDYWDTKQPGIFWFFALGVRLFGLSEEGVHAFELIWFLAFAAVLLGALRRAFDHRWGPAVAALMIVGFYWAVTEDWHQTQPEGLVQFPLFVAMWFSLEAARRERGAFPRWLIAGFAAGVVGVFKLLLVALPALFFVVALIARARDPRPLRNRDLALGVAGLAIGFAIPIAAMLAALAAQGVLGDAWYAWVVFPKRVTAEIHGLPLKAWKESFGWFFERWTAPLALALVGAWSSLRGRHAPLAIASLLWIGVGFPLLLVQKFSGWEYHLFLFLVPLGLLAARGIDALARPLRELRPPNAPRERRLMLALALALLFANPLASVLTKWAALVKDRFVTTTAMRHRHLLRASRGSAYFRFENEGAFLRGPDAKPGPIFVVGNPLVYWLSGRRQSVPRTGGILTDHYSAAEWADAVAHLDATRTPYVFVEPAEAQILVATRPRSDAFLDLLAARYRVASRDAYGTWYERLAADSLRARP